MNYYNEAGIKMKKIAFLSVTVLLLFVLPVSIVFSQEEDPDAQSSSTNEKVEPNPPHENSYTPGIIFNTGNILLDLKEYQSGVGIKLRGESYSIRGLFSVSYESSNDEFDTNIGVTYERPFFSGRVSPYWGVAVKGGYNLEKDETDSDNWMDTNVLTAHLAFVFGTEVYLSEFLSVFAEYNLGGAVSRTKVVQSSSGTETENKSTNFSIGTELGNEASLGVVIYLEKRPIEEKTEEEEVLVEKE